MVNNDLLGYVKNQLSLNVPKETIILNLKNAGWTDSDISEVFASMELPSVSSSPASTEAVSLPEGIHSTPGSKTARILSIVVVLLLFFGIGGGIYAYYKGGFVSLPSILSESIERTGKATSYTYDIVFKTDLREIGEQNFIPNPITPREHIKEFSIHAIGSVDKKDKNNLKHSSTISVSVEKTLVEIELRVISKTLYARLINAPIELTQSMPYKDAWFSISEETIRELSGNSVVKDNRPTTEQIDYLNKLLIEKKVIKPLSKLSPETMGGQITHHFSYEIDKTALVSFIQSAMKYFNENTEEDLTRITEALDYVKELKGEMWIGKNDKLIRKVTLDFRSQPDPKKDEAIKTNIIIVMSGWNEKVTIEAPGESVPFLSLIQASLVTARQKAQEAAIKSNMSNLRAQAELFYDQPGSYSGFCVSKELKDARKSIEVADGTQFICRDSAKAYVISTKMSQASGYWCVDSTGASKSTMTSPSGLSCPK
jgi:hypothetical protein